MLEPGRFGERTCKLDGPVFEHRLVLIFDLRASSRTFTCSTRHHHVATHRSHVWLLTTALYNNYSIRTQTTKPQGRRSCLSVLIPSVPGDFPQVYVEGRYVCFGMEAASRRVRLHCWKNLPPRLTSAGSLRERREVVCGVASRSFPPGFNQTIKTILFELISFR